MFLNKLRKDRRTTQRGVSKHHIIITMLSQSEAAPQATVLGGLAGTQIGNGRGRTAATIVGALSGGSAGNTVEHAVHKATSYDVQVRMGDGS
ncbi:MAG: hypothetical protein QOD67_1141, partial [Caballeronia sp.]|nr:hypothetical protein [Caballeronia sp.]